jgi:predicted DNA-binding protein
VKTRSPSHPSKKTTIIRISNEHLEHVKALAAAHYTTVSKIVNECIRRALPDLMKELNRK